MRLRLAAAALAPSIALAWSCATEPIADPRADVDPNAPALDASWAPEPYAARPAPGGGAPIDDAPPVTDGGGARDVEPEPEPPSLATRRAAAGEIELTEVMFDALGPEPAGEWFEVHNAAAAPLSLGGLTLRDGADRAHTIEGDVVVPPGGYAVLARDREGAIAEGVPAETIAYVYGAGIAVGEGVLLANGKSGAIGIYDGAAELARVAYGALALEGASGRSAQRERDDGAAWCTAAPTPGAASLCVRP